MGGGSLDTPVSTTSCVHYRLCPVQVPIAWDPVDVTPVKGPDGAFHIPQKAVDSVNTHGVGLKGPLATPIGKGHKSLNLALRK